MPSRRRIGASGSIFENHAIVAQENTMHGMWTQCLLSVKFDQARTQGMVSLRLVAGFDEVDAKHVTLWLSPEIFQRLEAGFDPERIPISIKQHLSRNVSFQSYDNILILSLALNAPGRLITPHDATVLTPISEYQTRARNFQSLCRSTQLLLYIPILNLPELRRTALEQFIDLGATGTLASLPTDFSRIQRRRDGREATWEIFNIPELPPSYGQQTEPATLKRAQEESPTNQTGAFLKRLASDFGAVSPGAAAYVSNSDSDTDFSHLLLSPLRPSHAATSPHSGSAQPAAAAHNAPQGKLLHATPPGLLREMLPGVLREMLPELVRACLRDLLPDALNHLLFPAPPSSQDSEKSSSDIFVDRVVEPVVVRHLPQVVRDYIELEDPLEDYMGAADVEIKEASYNAVLEIKEAKEEGIAEIKQAETDVVERLTGVDWNVIGKEIMGLTPSQQSYSEQSNSGTGMTAARQDHSEQEGGREEVEDEGPGEHLGMEHRIYASEAQGGNRVFSRTGLRYGSQATTTDETESPGRPSSEALRVRSESSYGSRNTTRQNSRTSSLDLQAPASDRSVQPMESGKEVGLDMGSRRNSNDNIDVGEADRDEREDRGENEGLSGTQQGELFGMAWADSWTYGTTEPDTESDPSRAG